VNNATLFVVLMCLLGAFVGTGLGVVFTVYMTWVRRTKEPTTVRLWRGLFMLVAIPALFLPPILAGAESIISSGADDDAYLLGFLAGLLGAALY
jgi:hypothetical protein